MKVLLEYAPPYDWSAMPDAFPSGDVGLINALAALEGEAVTARQLLQRAEVWRPYRGYATQVLWTSLSRTD
jgi:DNA-3-methyladenine glycosylase II